MSHLELFDRQQKYLKCLQEDFVSKCEAAFFEQAVVFYLTELVMMSFLSNYFETSLKFKNFIENNILHKLEFTGITNNLSQTLGLIYKHSYFSNNFLVKLMSKTAIFVNDNIIENTDFIHILKGLRFIAFRNVRDDFLMNSIEKFLILIKSKILEVPIENFQFNLAMLGIISIKKFRYIFNISNQDYRKTLLDTFLSRTNVISPKVLNIFFRSIATFDDLDENTLNKLHIIVIGNVQKVSSWTELYNIQYFYYKVNLSKKDAALKIIKLKFIDLMLNDTPMHPFFSKNISLIRRDGILFNQILEKYLDDSRKSQSRQKETSDTEEEEDVRDNKV